MINVEKLISIHATCATSNATYTHVITVILHNDSVTDVKTASDSPWTESPAVKVNGSFVQAYLALDSFQNWTITTLQRLIEFDQATLFSG